MPSSRFADIITLLDSPPFWPHRGKLKKYIHSSIDHTLASLRNTSPSSPIWRQALLSPVEINVLLSHDSEIQHLNAHWRHKDVPTNILSFPAMSSYDKETPLFPHTTTLFLGDIALSYETCHQEATAQKKVFCHHIAHLVTHGILHLLGFDHQTPEEAEVMESLEIDLLRTQNIANPYLAH